MNSMYRSLLAEGDGEDAPTRVEVRREEDRVEAVDGFAPQFGSRQLRPFIEGLCRKWAIFCHRLLPVR